MRFVPGDGDAWSVKTLVVLNDPPYGTEGSYNGLRLANALAKREREHVRIFLMADAVGCAMAGQRTPNGYYNMERLLSAAARHGAEIGLCAWMHAQWARERSLKREARRD